MAALLDNYRTDHEFAELRLIVDPAGEVVSFRTVFDGERFALRIDADHVGRPSVRLESRPWRSWASTWNRLTEHSLDTDRNKYDMTLDANLRRIQSWSTALQYIEDYAEWRPRPMTQIQQVLWELRMDYIGHPYYGAGTALCTLSASTSTWRRTGRCR